MRNPRKSSRISGRSGNDSSSGRTSHRCTSFRRGRSGAYRRRPPSDCPGGCRCNSRRHTSPEPTPRRSAHVMNPQTVRRFRPHVMGLPPRWTDTRPRHQRRAAGILFRLPTAAGRILPFRLRRQPIGLSRLVVQLPDKILNVVPTHLLHGIIVVALVVGRVVPMSAFHCPWVTSYFPR